MASKTRRRRNVYNTHKPLKPVETAENIPVRTKLAVEQMAWYILTEWLWYEKLPVLEKLYVSTYNTDVKVSSIKYEYIVWYIILSNSYHCVCNTIGEKLLMRKYLKINY